MKDDGGSVDLYAVYEPTSVTIAPSGGSCQCQTQNYEVFRFIYLFFEPFIFFFSFLFSSFILCSFIFSSSKLTINQKKRGLKGLCQLLHLYQFHVKGGHIKMLGVQLSQEFGMKFKIMEVVLF